MPLTPLLSRQLVKGSTVDGMRAMVASPCLPPFCSRRHCSTHNSIPASSCLATVANYMRPLPLPWPLHTTPPGQGCRGVPRDPGGGRHCRPSRRHRLPQRVHQRKGRHHRRHRHHQGGEWLKQQRGVTTPPGCGKGPSGEEPWAAMSLACWCIALLGQPCSSSSSSRSTTAGACAAAPQAGAGRATSAAARLRQQVLRPHSHNPTPHTSCCCTGPMSGVAEP